MTMVKLDRGVIEILKAVVREFAPRAEAQARPEARRMTLRHELRFERSQITRLLRMPLRILGLSRWSVSLEP